MEQRRERGVERKGDRKGGEEREKGSGIARKFRGQDMFFYLICKSKSIYS